MNFRREDLMKKEANYLNINCCKCGEHFDATQFMNPAKKHLGLYAWDAIPTIFPVSNPPHTLKNKCIISINVTVISQSVVHR